ncbi:putative HAT dimerization domain-containing protein [Helianthus annuus]|nr:putative HAT dimerization domain-containing protein [Helianthus annuus]
MYDIFLIRYCRTHTHSRDQVIRQVGTRSLIYLILLEMKWLDDNDVTPKAASPRDIKERILFPHIFLRTLKYMISWRKENESQFSILAVTARDLLCVQASTVTLEFAFSLSGKVLSI